MGVVVLFLGVFYLLGCGELVNLFDGGINYGDVLVFVGVIVYVFYNIFYCCWVLLFG